MAHDGLNRDHIETLLDRLGALHVSGPSRGAPYVGILHNDLTREIMAVGKTIIPSLIARLPASGYDEAVYIVFLLRELHAKEAEPAVRRLQTEVAARSIGRDLTLKMQVEYFLRDMQEWEETR